ncbi:hypothetical protein Tcan_02485 [Toxocara canis]|uniref:Uncharacterized protein n=1 Tax=Toxocara canis TaxID=6265 RepID=A0A0B2UPR1_TOXCA|nr:hypothetical protein Tcan_02485 [Toxocara canis]
MLASPQLENECGSQQYDVRKTIREAELNEMGEEIMQWPDEAKNSRGFGLMSKEAGDGEKRLESGNDPPNQTLELKSQTARAIRQDGRDLFGTTEETQPERLESEAMSFALQVERIAEENEAKLAGLRKERDELKLKVAELEKDLQDSAEVKRVVHDALQLCEEMKDGLLQLAELSAKETSRLQCRIKELEEELAKERSRLDEVCKQKYHELENVSNESDTLLGQAAQQEGLTSKCTQTHVNRKATLWNMSGCACEQQVVFEEVGFITIKPGFF